MSTPTTTKHLMSRLFASAATVLAVGVLVAGCGLSATAPKHVSPPKATSKKMSVASKKVAPPSNSPTLAQVDQEAVTTLQSLGMKNVVIGAPPGTTGLQAFQAYPTNNNLRNLNPGQWITIGGPVPLVANETTASEIQGFGASLQSLVTTLPASTSSQLKASSTVYAAFAYANNGKELDFVIFWK